MKLYVLQDSKNGTFYFNEIAGGDESEFMTIEEVAGMIDLYELKEGTYKVYELVEISL